MRRTSWSVISAFGGTTTRQSGGWGAMSRIAGRTRTKPRPNASGLVTQTRGQCEKKSGPVISFSSCRSTRRPPADSVRATQAIASGSPTSLILLRIPSRSERAVTPLIGSIAHILAAAGGPVHRVPREIIPRDAGRPRPSRRGSRGGHRGSPAECRALPARDVRARRIDAQRHACRRKNRLDRRNGRGAGLPRALGSHARHVPSLLRVVRRRGRGRRHAARPPGEARGRRLRPRISSRSFRGGPRTRARRRPRCAT